MPIYGYEKNRLFIKILMVSVIILNYNTTLLTIDCIRSIKEKTTIQYEIILVDNNSSDRTIENIKTSFPEITYVQSNINLGFSKGVNLGIGYSKYPFVLLLNSDTLLINSAIDLSYEKMTLNPEIGALTSKILLPNGGIQYCSVESPKFFPYIFGSLFLNKLFHYKSKYIFEIENDIEHFTDEIHGTFFFFRRDILHSLEENKLFDGFFMYVEDHYWSWQIKNIGYKILYYPNPKILHLDNSFYLKVSNERKISNLKNYFFYIKKSKGCFFLNIYIFSKLLFLLTHLEFKEIKINILALD